MGATFTPPSRVLIPVITAATPKHQQRPFGYFKPSIPRGANVWIYTNNTVSEQQPLVWLPRTNADGSITPGVKKVFYGGHSYRIDENEVAVLTAAGYAANIAHDGILGTTTYDNGDIYS